MGAMKTVYFLLKGKPKKEHVSFPWPLWTLLGEDIMPEPLCPPCDPQAEVGGQAGWKVGDHESTLKPPTQESDMGGSVISLSNPLSVVSFPARPAFNREAC